MENRNTTVVFMAQLQPLIPDVPREMLHRAIYGRSASHSSKETEA